MDGASRVRIHSITGYLRDQLQVDPIRDATPVERVERIARLYMLVILGGILFPNTSGNLISLQYLAFLDPIHDVGKYSWGSAVHFVEHLSIMWLTFADLFLSFR